jgi:putative NADH-flavin reductase
MNSTCHGRGHEFPVGAVEPWPQLAIVQGAAGPASGQTVGEYRLGDDIAVQPQDGGAISSADYAIGLVDLIEHDNHHRAHVNLAH